MRILLFLGAAGFVIVAAAAYLVAIFLIWDNLFAGAASLIIGIGCTAMAMIFADEFERTRIGPTLREKLLTKFKEG